MKKFLVLGVLFILPIVAYLFFSSGVNNFAKLPVLTPQISNLEDFTSLDGNKVVLDNKITILSIYGSNIEVKEGNAFNLNEKIYDKKVVVRAFRFWDQNWCRVSMGTMEEMKYFTDAIEEILV